jgi:protein-disulfide isomerase
MGRALRPRLLAVSLLLGLTGCGARDQPRAREPLATAHGATKLAERFARIPQRRAVFGSPRAPYTMVEFVDLQCPYCARFDRDVLPAVIERFVRPARLRLELRPIRLLGPESATSGAATVAAGLQDRMWQFADLFYRNQGRENSGYVTEAFVARIAAAVPGLDARRLRRDLTSARVRRILVDNERSARTARIAGTPTFRVGPTGGVLERFDGRRLERRDFVRRLEAALR